MSYEDLILYYDMEGQPTDAATWAALYTDTARRRLATTDVDGVVIATVWSGIPHNIPIDPARGPEIFGTALILHRSGNLLGTCIVEKARYATREAALLGHAHWTERVQQGKYDLENET